MTNACQNPDGFDLNKIKQLSQLVEGTLDSSSNENRAFLDSLQQKDERTQTYRFTFFQRLSLGWTSWRYFEKDKEKYYAIVAQKMSSYTNSFFKDCAKRFQKDINIFYNNPQTTFIEACSFQQLHVVEVLLSHLQIEIAPLTFLAGCDQLSSKSLPAVLQLVPDTPLLYAFSLATQEYDLKTEKQLPILTTHFANECTRRFKDRPVPLELFENLLQAYDLCFRQAYISPDHDHSERWQPVTEQIKPLVEAQS